MNVSNTRKISLLNYVNSIYVLLSTYVKSDSNGTRKCVQRQLKKTKLFTDSWWKRVPRKFQQSLHKQNQCGQKKNMASAAFRTKKIGQRKKQKTLDAIPRKTHHVAYIVI